MLKKTCLITAPLGATFKALLINEEFFDTLRTKFDEIHVVTTLSETEVKKVMEGVNDEDIFYHYYNNHKLGFWPRIYVQISFLSFGLCYKLKVFDVKMVDGSITIAQKLLLILLKIPGIILGYGRIFRFSERMKYNTIHDQFIANVIKKVKPAVVMASAISFTFDYPVIMEAFRKKIPILGMVHSWDNITTKGPIYYEFEKVIVWNEFQKNELLKYYNYSENQIEMVGIPQIDLLINNQKYDKKRLFDEIGIDIKTKLISYMTIAPKLCPFDNKIIGLLLKQLNKIKEPWHFRVRLHPQDRIEHYQEFKNNSKISFELVSDRSKRVLDGMSFQKGDIFHYGELLTNSDIVLSVGSTVAIEAVTLGTPFIHLKFDDKLRAFRESVTRFYQYEHMQYVLNFKAYEVAESPKKTIELIQKYLKDPNRLKKEREYAIKKINYNMDGKAGKRIAKLIGEYSND